MPTMDELNALQNAVATQNEEEKEANTDNFGTEEKQELTPEEQETLEKLQAQYGDKPILVVNDTDEDGHTSQIPAKEYLKSLDKKVTSINTPEEGMDEMDKMIKTVNSGDIKQSLDGIKAEARARTIQAFRSLAVNNDDTKSLTDDQIVEINSNALSALQKYFNMDRLNSDELAKNLRKMPLDKICEILPEEFWSVYVTNNEVKLRNPGARDRLISAIAFLTTTGPEFDYLNEYIEEENKLMLVSKRLMQCQVEFTEMLKDEKKISELVTETYQYVPEDTSIWSKEIKMPNRVHNEFAQRYVIYDHYRKAYEALMTDYPVDIEDEKEKNVNTRAREIIQQEIDECDMKMNVYMSICNLDLFKELLGILIDRFKTNKKINMKYLTQEAERAIESVKRCKQNLPFPGFRGTERKTEQLLANYLVAFPAAIRKYNEAVDKVMSREDATAENLGDISKITLPEFEDNDTFVIYSLLMVIMMGRILKKCTRNDATKYDAIVLDAYFYIFNRMGSDLYLMNDIWKMMLNLTGYTLQTWYIPEKIAANKKKDGGKK